MSTGDPYPFRISRTANGESEIMWIGEPADPYRVGKISIPSLSVEAVKPLFDRIRELEARVAELESKLVEAEGK